ncbi:MAG: ATP-binding cassette domain-containing protein, partial [Paraburkholderia tropica]
MNASAPVALSVKNIHKSFGDHHVLKGISLDAHEGDVISILGASGSGKSTFLRCLNLLEMPDDGSVSLGGEALKMKRRRDGKLQPEDRRQVDRVRSQLGMVFQNFNLWSHMTVLDNLIEGPMGGGERPRG